MRKTVLSVILAFAIFVSSIIPAFSTIENNNSSSPVSVQDEKYALNAENSLSQIISDVLTPTKTEDSLIDTQYNIAHVELLDNVASVTYNSISDCNIVVSIYDERTEEIIATGIANIEEDDAAAIVPIGVEELPEYYLLKAVLVDSNYTPLSGEYVDTDKTEWYANFKSTVATDFNDDLVIKLDEEDDENNFVVLTEAVKRIAVGMNQNTLVSHDFETNILSIDNIDDSVRYISKGDIICYNYQNAHEMIVGKVGSIAIKGTEATIIISEASMGEAFDFVKINYECEQCYFEDEESPDKPEASNTNAISNGQATYTGSYSKTFNFPSNYSWLKGSATIKIGVTVSVEYSVWDKYVSAELKITPSASLTTNISMKKSVPPITLGSVTIPTPIAGLAIDLTIKLIIDVSASITATVSVSSTIGFRWNNRQNRPTNLSTAPVTTARIEIKGRFYIGIEVVPSVSVLYGVAKLGIGGEIGAEINAKMNTEYASDATVRHDCFVCIAIDVDAKIKVNVNLSVKIPLLIDYKNSWNLYERKIDIGDYYYSADRNEFRSGSCPHYKYKVTIAVKNTSGSVIPGAKIDGTSIGNKGVLEKFFANGQHTITVTANGYKTRIVRFGVSKAPQNVVVRLTEGSSSETENQTDASYASSIINSSPGGSYTPPLMYVEPAEGVILSIALAAQRRNDVAWVQRELQKLGYALSVDGYFGTETENAVRKFQSDYAIPVDGRVGATTLSFIKYPARSVLPPSLVLLSPLDISSGGIATVTWNAIENADCYTVYLYKDGNHVNTVFETKALTASFVLYDAGKYSIKAIAKNFRYTSALASIEKEITVHNPALVTFLDWDGTVLSRQFVGYGDNAVAPAAPERMGYTFSKWDANFYGIKVATLTVNAQYIKNQYTVKFFNYDGTLINSQKVYYGEAAITPDAVEVPPGYAFIGWDRDFSNVTSEMNLKPLFNWINDDLPILIEESNVYPEETGYTVVVTVRNYDKKRTNGRIVVALKTSSGRFLTMTESSAFSLAASNSSANIFKRETFEIFVPCDEVAAIADIFVVETFNQLIPISESVRCLTGFQTETTTPTFPPITGFVDPSLSGKQATLFIYKIGEAADYTNEFVGQTVIGEDGSYFFDFILREEPSVETGDYTVTLGIEGANTKLYLESIKAPVPSYTVNICDYDGSVINTQQVKRGESAVLPTENPQRVGYIFAGWDYSNASIYEDTNITAIYVPREYVVVFIDWTNERFDMHTYRYGEPLITPDMTNPEEYDAIGWEGVVAGMTVTQNMVITAKYEKKTFTVKFYDYDKNVIAEKQVEYGQAVEIPALESNEEHIFLSWAAASLNCVTTSMDVYPDYFYARTVETPVSGLASGIYGSAKTITLACATPGAVIYYAINGGEEQVYTGPITIEETAKIDFYAAKEGYNDSESAWAYCIINETGNQSAWKYPVTVYEDGVIVGLYIVDAGSMLEGDIINRTREGYELEGYYLDAGYTQRWNTETDTIGVGTVLYAKWIQKQYSVTFAYENGESISEQTVPYLEAAEEPPLVDVPDGMVFVGWDTDAFRCVTSDLMITAIIIKETDLVGIELNKKYYTMMEGYTYSLTVSLFGSPTADIVWLSDDESVVQVDQHGNLLAVAKGEAFITAYLVGQHTSASCFVTVMPNPYLSIAMNESSPLILSNDILHGIKPSIRSVQFVRAQIMSNNIRFYNDGVELTDSDEVSTGTMVVLYDENMETLDCVSLVVTGDVNGDGKVNNKDVALITRYLVGKDTLSVLGSVAADINADGNVNNRDASMLARYLVGKENI